ncbi:MAG: nucleic acid-binding protein [Thermoplasmata archaeon]|nr:nucleic acid-binding protein [Thermoplasmata archaeon]
MPFVLDASALLAGKDLLLEEMFCTPHVLEEVKGKDPTIQLMSMIETRVEVRDPSDESVTKVNEAAGRTGDAKRLSPADVGVIALAIDLDATIITDDYSIQNVANELGLDYSGLSFPDIKRKVEWGYRCVGCGKRFEEPMDECPICGSRIKTTPKSTSRISSASADRSE